jgi:hypothetical protein
LLDSEDPGLAVLSAASLRIDEDLGTGRTDLEGALGWTRAASWWLISLGILAVVYVLYPHSRVVELLAVLDLAVGGMCFAATAFWILRLHRRSQHRAEDWEASFLPLLYRVKFEMLPYSGTDRLHDAWERYKSVYRDLSWADTKSAPGKRRRPLLKAMLKFHGEVTGAKAPHSFDVYCSIGSERGFFARRFDQSVPVSKSQLEVLKADVEDVRKRFGERKCIVAALSPADFEPGAVEYALSEEGRVDGKFPLDLIQEAGTGFTVVSAASA